MKKKLEKIITNEKLIIATLGTLATGACYAYSGNSHHDKVTYGIGIGASCAAIGEFVGIIYLFPLVDKFFNYVRKKQQKSKGK